MQKHPAGRRDFLVRMTALGAAGLPVLAQAFRSQPLAASTGPVSASAIGAVGADAAAPQYDPSAKLDVSVSDVEFRRNQAGRMLMARVYRPNGAGPFPTVLDLHGGAW